MEWLFVLIMNVSLGLILIVCGYLIWKKEKISLIRRYHYKRVKEKDKKIYCTEIGTALIIFGLSFIIMWFINYFTNVSYGILVLAIGFITGMILFIHAEIKYNRD